MLNLPFSASFGRYSKSQHTLDAIKIPVGGGIMPDHPIIGQFVGQHKTLLTTEFFAPFTRQVLKAADTNTTTLAGDGTSSKPCPRGFNCCA